MGTLLSTPEGNGTEILGGQGWEREIQQTTEKRKRRTTDGDLRAPPKRQKKDKTTSAHFNNSILAKKKSLVNDNDSIAVVSDAVTENESSRQETSRPAKTRKSRKRKSRKAFAQAEPNHEKKSNQLPSIIEATARPHIQPKNISAGFPTRPSLGNCDPQLETPPPTKKRRKHTEPISPHFPLPKAHLSSPPPTPTPKKSLTTTSPKSKISIIESPGVLPSLPHFRPTSENEFGLIQEKLRHEPWKMLVAVIFLNVTTAKMALPLLGQLLERWPDAEALSKADFMELSSFLYPIGLYNTRARRLIDFSTMWLTHPPRHDVLTKRKGLAKYPPTAISHLPGMGVYALDSWRMFCAGEEDWRDVRPLDKELQAWMRWRWAREGKILKDNEESD